MSRVNFEYWKEIVGLEENSFPHLIKLDEENIHLARIPQSRIKEIQEAIITNRLVAVQVQPGWGMSTLFYYMAHGMKNSKFNLSVLFDFERIQLQDRELTEKNFIFQIKWKLANGILDIMMSQPLPECYMFEVFQFEDTGEKPWRAYLREKRRELNECLDNSQIFYQKFPFYAEMEVTECVDYFLRNFQIQTTFMYLFPKMVDEDSLLEFVCILKNIFDGKEIAPAAIREVFFLTPKMYHMMKQAYERPYVAIQYQRYSAAEIFGMLVNTYRLQNVAGATISDVFEQEFVICAYDKALTLEQIMDKVEEKIISNLEGKRFEIPYKLTMRAKNEGKEYKDDYE